MLAFTPVRIVEGLVAGFFALFGKKYEKTFRVARNALLDLAKRLFSYVRRVSSHLDHKPSRWSNTGLLGEIQVTLRILIAARARTLLLHVSIGSG